MSATKNNTQLTYAWRFRLVQVLLLLVVLVVVCRVVALQIFDRGFLQAQSDARTLRTESIAAHRGVISDRMGQPLAVSTPVYSVWLNPKELTVDVAANEKMLWKLAEFIGSTSDLIKKKIQNNINKEFIYLKRQLSPELAQKILALEIKGVHTRKEYRRYYPAGEVASHLVGFTNVDDKGQEGLELAYDEWLQGVPGSKRVLKDRYGQVIKDLQLLQAAKAGKQVELSIDLRLQYLAYRELKAAVQQYRAKSGSVVVLDVKTGEVLAMVNQPSYNPNNRNFDDISALRNRAVVDLFEPGSTIKPLTIAAALESNLVTPTTLIDTRPGYLKIGNKTIRDHRNYGVIDVATVITKSSNVGASKLAIGSGAEALWNVFSRVGFGQSAGAGFPGESVGVLSNYNEWGPLELATLSYGYGLSVTPLQLAQAYSVLANKGNYRPVSLVKVDKPAPSVRVLSEDVAHQVFSMLEAVVKPGGTGTKAQVVSYKVAGKTGTVHKVGKGGYVDDKYIAIFAGAAPVSNPRVVAVVTIDEPQGDKYYGGDVAAPVFSRVVAGAMRLLDVVPDDLPGQPNILANNSLAKSM